MRNNSSSIILCVNIEAKKVFPQHSIPHTLHQATPNVTYGYMLLLADFKEHQLSGLLHQL